ncbi:MAG: hypothetical protein AB1444_00140 [Spirochaetota bacterium]
MGTSKYYYFGCSLVGTIYIYDKTTFYYMNNYGRKQFLEVPIKIKKAIVPF